jgi:hypothetical protein
MPKTLVIGAALAVIAVALYAAPAAAQANRTFVSGSGSDDNPCSHTAPCRSFARAITQTSPGGEIAVLDTAGYGAVTITQAVSIVNEEGVEAGITVTSGDGITITAGATDVVNLRGLTLVGAGGDNGITFNSGAALNIQNCVIRGFTGAFALNLVPTISADINVSNTIVSGNLGGIFLSPSGTALTVTASFEQVRAIHNAIVGFLVSGSAMTGSLSATATDSLASGGITGFESFSAAGKAATTFILVNSKATNNNGTGVVSDGTNATVFLNGTTLPSFSAGNGGVINSYGNNAITSANNQGTLTSVSLR